LLFPQFSNNLFLNFRGEKWGQIYFTSMELTTAFGEGSTFKESFKQGKNTFLGEGSHFCRRVNGETFFFPILEGFPQKGAFGHSKGERRGESILKPNPHVWGNKNSLRPPKKGCSFHQGGGSF